ncbi:helix-turn-helix transcriptional regulator [Deinococcus sp. SDU3-2]|uniref:Helix-turn-helix transcriptional regulator n=1 Tax=Deinococcus terrestris TaxID=2651870 RepID=A0A7X1NVR2_9DEIO|nr:helix-turn-helix transcriptional regulator [Deinococcus terrestris]MPY66676.1 helix-turn-helix transcriptional regulator [Deinococcus terrestris]
MTETAPPLSAPEAGEFLRRKLRERGLTQAQLAARAGIPDPGYLSHLLKGRVNVAGSKYLRAIAGVLGLTAGELRRINPALVVEEVALPALPSPDIPEGLREAGERYAAVDPLIAHPKVQAALAQAGNFYGRGPQTAPEWFRYFTSVREWIEVDP